MKQWESFFVWWPRKIEGRWTWLTKAERTWACGGGGLGGDFWFIYRRLAKFPLTVKPEESPSTAAALRRLLEVYQAMGNPRGPAEIMAEEALAASPARAIKKD